MSGVSCIIISKSCEALIVDLLGGSQTWEKCGKVEKSKEKWGPKSGKSRVKLGIKARKKWGQSGESVDRKVAKMKLQFEKVGKMKQQFGHIMMKVRRDFYFIPDAKSKKLAEKIEIFVKFSFNRKLLAKTRRMSTIGPSYDKISSFS